MGVTTLKIQVANPERPSVTARLEFTVDSGAVYSVVPAQILRKLRIRPQRRQTFRLANGATIVRQKGVALFKFQGYVGGGDVIFGETEDATLLGALTLEALGLSLDPIKRQLRPMLLTL